MELGAPSFIRTVEHQVRFAASLVRISTTKPTYVNRNIKDTFEIKRTEQYLLPGIGEII